MKIFGWICALVLSCVVLIQSPAVSAHIVANDGPMEVTLHIDPEDDPIVNHPQTLTIIYHDNTGKFNAYDCSCAIVINQNGSQVFQANAPVEGSYFSQIDHTFKKTGYYQIKVTGSPKTPNSFTPFAVTYSVKVNEPEGQEPEPYNVNSTIFRSAIIGTGALAIVLVFYLIYLEIRRSPRD